VLKDVLADVDVETVLCHNHYMLWDTRLLELVPLAANKQVGLTLPVPVVRRLRRVNVKAAVQHMTQCRRSRS
jgi:hypothetical protein